MLDAHLADGYSPFHGARDASHPEKKPANQRAIVFGQLTQLLLKFSSSAEVIHTSESNITATRPSSFVTKLTTRVSCLPGLVATSNALSSSTITAYRPSLTVVTGAEPSLLFPLLTLFPLLPMSKMATISGSARSQNWSGPSRLASFETSLIDDDKEAVVAEAAQANSGL